MQNSTSHELQDYSTLRRGLAEWQQ